MFERTLCFVVYLLLLSFPCQQVHAAPDKGARDNKENGNEIPHKEIQELSLAIKAAPSYRQDMRKSINLLEDSLSHFRSQEERCELALKLSKRFRSFNTDSSLYYAFHAMGVAEKLDHSYLQRTEVAVIDALSTSGLFTEASDRFNTLGREKMSGQTQLDYWLAGRRLYGYMCGYAEGNSELLRKYEARYRQLDDSLLMHLPDGSNLKRFIECERLVAEKRYRHAQHNLADLLADLPEDTNLYGMAAYQMALVWKNLGDEYRYATMLAVSAISDVKGCISEGMALPSLAEWLYQKGELNHSFAFINFALEEATSGNARMRAVTIARFVPLIDDAYRDKIKYSRDELMVYFILMAILLVATVLLVVFLVKQIRKTKANTLKLEHTAKRQEAYIGNFIGLYSNYADRLNHLARLVSTKLASGQIAELKKLMDSGKFSDQDNEDIHKIFDSAFLHIYPDYIESVNSLLRPEESIVVKTPGTLTPELRIYAFVKLGIEESARIAQILHYSVNTVYAYSNKMRNRALHRDTFDADIKNL